MATASLNIPIEIPNSTVLNLEELKQQLTDYARKRPIFRLDVGLI